MSIYKKQSEDPKYFNSAEEFLKYYDNNRKDIDNTHTRSLNLKYKINGHTICRKQNKLILYPLKENTMNDSISESEISLDQKFDKLKDVVMKLIEEVNELKIKLDEITSPQDRLTASQSTIHQKYCHK